MMHVCQCVRGPAGGARIWQMCICIIAGRTGSAVLEVTGLTRDYGSHLAIADVSFQVADGELLTIVGPSGCGKSTLLRCLAGLLPPTSGRVVLDGAPVTR